MRKIIKILPFLLMSFDVFGQLTPITSQYVLNPVIINPAYAGSRGALNLAAFYRNQWVNIKGAPVTMTFSIDAPISKEKIGLGLMIVNDKIGVTKETNFISSYAYKIGIGDGNLSLGLSAGMSVTNTHWSDLVVLDPGDQLYLTNQRIYIIPNFSFGLYYSYHNFYSGLSLPKLLTYKFDFQKNKYALSYKPKQYNYLFTTGYAFTLNPKIKFLPSALLNYAAGEKLQYDLNAHFSLIDKFFVGVSYRNNRALAGIFQLQINTQFRIAYSYDFELGNLGKYSNGSHEIMLRYEFRYKVNAVSPLNL